jgi:quinol monooxygenase YgiN
MYETIALQTDVIHPGDHHNLDCISTDREFQNLIPAISDDERRQLEENIVEAGGVRDPLTLWLRDDNDWVILDGHNRFEICQRLKLPFPFHQVEFDTRDQAADWIDRNQLGRRNLSDEGRKILLGRLYNRSKKAEHDGGKGKRRSGGQTEHHSEKTSERVAREQGVSAATVRRAGKLQAAAAELGIEQEIVAGEIKATEAEIVKAAATLPDKPTADDVAQARERVRASGTKRAKGKQSDKPTAGESRRKNGQQADKITRALIALRTPVELLARTDSAYRDQALAELQRLVSQLSRVAPAAPAKSEKRKPDDELRAAVVERWEKMRLWEKHWSLAEMKDVRRLFIELIRDEQKQLDK